MLTYTADPARIQSPRQINTEQTAIRHRLLDLGYEPFRNFGGKARMPADWPNLEVSHEAIDAWFQPRSAKFTGTSIRVEKGPAFYIDIDTDDPKITAAIEDILKRHAPAFAAHAVRRHSGGASLMLIGRYNGITGALSSARFVRTAGDKKKHLVEIFGIGARRQVAMAGPHTIINDKVTRMYAFTGAPLWEREIDSLPFFPQADGNATISDFLKECEAAMASLGLILDQPPKLVDTGFKSIYDLEPDLAITLQAGDVISAEDLEKALVGGGEVRCFAPWDPKSSTDDRCIARLGKTGLVITDFKQSVSHRWASRKPVDGEQFRVTMQAILALAGPQATAVPPGPQAAPQGAQGGARSGAGPQPAAAAPGPQTAPQGGGSGIAANDIVKLLTPDKPAQPPDDAELSQKAAYLIMTVAFAPATGKAIDLYATSADSSEWPLLGFQFEYAKWFETIPGPKQGKGTTFTAPGIWQREHTRLTIHGILMSPQESFPVYRDAKGRLIKNLYKPPVHIGDGEIDTPLEFMEHLVPDLTECSYVLDWMASLIAKPWIPGVALVFVDSNTGDAEFGCGRGTWYEIMTRLIGEDYVTEVDSALLTGANSQAAYTDWETHNVLVYVSEMNESSDGTYRSRNAAAEVMKSKIDTRARRKRFTAKYGKNFDAVTYASYAIATNHGDPFPMHRGARRHYVANNGARLTAEKARKFNAWMAVPGNIAAFHRFLMARATAPGFTFDPYQPPPVTAGMRRMIDMSEGEIEKAFRAVLDDLKTPHVAKKQLRLLVQKHLEHPEDLELRSRGSTKWTVFDALCRKFLFPVFLPSGKQRTVIDNNTYVFATSARTAQTAGIMPAKELYRSVLKNGTDGLVSAAKGASEPPAGEPAGGAEPDETSEPDDSTPPSVH